MVRLVDELLKWITIDNITVTNVKTAPAGTTLSSTDKDGKNPAKLGFVVSLPQGCRASRPGGSTKYGSPEWIKEIAYIAAADMKDYDPAVTRSARQFLGPHRISNDYLSNGCGGVSKSVTVTQIKPGPPFTEIQHLGSTTALFYSLVSKGYYENHLDLSSPYVASEIWICEGQWDPNFAEYKAAMDRVKDTVSPCPG